MAARLSGTGQRAGLCRAVDAAGNAEDVTLILLGATTLNGDLDIGSSSTLQTSADIVVNGAVTRGAGSVTQETRNISSDAAYNFSLAGVSVNFDNRDSLSSLVVRRTESAPPNENAAGGGAHSLDRYYTLGSDANPIQAEMCFGYNDAELGELDENQLCLCRRIENGWGCPARGVSSNATANVVCADDISQFSDWVIGQTDPPAVKLQAFGARLRGQMWVGLAFGVVALVGCFVWRKCKDFVKA